MLVHTLKYIVQFKNILYTYLYIYVHTHICYNALLAYFPQTNNPFIALVFSIVVVIINSSVYYCLAFVVFRFVCFLAYYVLSKN